LLAGSTPSPFPAFFVALIPVPLETAFFVFDVAADPRAVFDIEAERFRRRFFV
jgi:hypothetical protein